MNYFAHALPFLDRPYFAAATGIPDWLTVVDRRVRLRLKQVEPFRLDGDPLTAAVAGGIRQHLLDDARFHATRAFVETMMAMTAIVRETLGIGPGFRASFLGHLLVEVLLDAALVEEHPDELRRYYELLDSTDPDRLEAVVNRIAAKRTDRLAALIRLFREHRILSDYAEDGRLLGRMNQVMRRVKQPGLPDDFVRVFAEGRPLVRRRRAELLEGIPALE